MNLNLVSPISNWIYLFPKITLLTNTRAGGTWICHLIYGHFCHWSIKHYNPVSKEPHSGQLVIAAWPPKCLRPCVSRKTFQNPRLQPRFFYSYFIVHEIHRYQSLVVTQSIKVSRVVSLKYSCLLWLWYVLKWNLTFHLLTLIWSTAFHHSGHTKAWYW